MWNACAAGDVGLSVSFPPTDFYSLSAMNASVPTISLPRLTASAKQPLVKTELPSLRRTPLSKSALSIRNAPSRGFGFREANTLASHPASTGVTCFGALNARCSTEQQTIQQQSAVITNAPLRGEEKSPEIDDGGTGFPPRDDGDGGGGGGGGGGGWKGGFFFFGFLAFLGFLKDQEGEGPYRDEGRRSGSYS